jgi:protein-tyrosine phosphatase
MTDLLPDSSFLTTDGIHNLRDYGGYGVSGGGRVRTGLLFRSGQHIEATDSDLEALRRLDIRTVIDLRGKSERLRFPCRRPSEFAARVIAHDGETTSSPPHEGGAGTDQGRGESTGERAPAAMTASLAHERMLSIYTRMPSNSAMIAMFGAYLEALADRDGASLVHCFAGKDRTGIAASLLLHAIGVHRDDIVTEFLKTNLAPTVHVLERQSLPRIEAHYGPIDAEARAALLGVRSEYIETYFAAIENEHGSTDNFLARALGVDDKRKARLIERFVG